MKEVTNKENHQKYLVNFKTKAKFQKVNQSKMLAPRVIESAEEKAHRLETQGPTQKLGDYKTMKIALATFGDSEDTSEEPGKFR